MSLSFGSSKKSTKTSQQQDPWEPTIGPLEDLISQIGDYSGNVGATQGQQDAFSQLMTNAGEGNPFAGQIQNLAGDLFTGVDSRSGTVDDAYARLQDQLGGIAAGDNLDVNENPYLQTMLQQNADNIMSRINQQFAGAGRDLSGRNQQAVARGVSEGTIPTLFNQYNLERQNQANAANQLFGAGTNAAQAAQGLDLAALNNRLQGVGAADAYTAARDYGPNTMLALEQQMKQLPIEDLGRIEALLGPIAQLGMQASGKSTSKGTSAGLGISNLFGGLGALLSSDERAKEGIDGPQSKPEQVGELADGTPIYRYKYKGDPTQATHIGVMAQEIEGSHPDAVAMGPDGMRRVDYAAATEDSAQLMGGMAPGMADDRPAGGVVDEEDDLWRKIMGMFGAGQTA